MNYLENDCTVITLNSDKKSLYSIWKRFPTDEEYRTALDALIDGMVQYKVTKLVTVTHNLGAISENNQKWTNENWFPRAVGVGYNKIAIVVSDDIFNQLAVEDIMSQIGNFETKYFDKEPDALAWI